MRTKVHVITVGVLLIIVGLGMMFYRYPQVLLGIMCIALVCMFYLVVYSIVEFVHGRK